MLEVWKVDEFIIIIQYWNGFPQNPNQIISHSTKDTHFSEVVLE